MIRRGIPLDLKKRLWGEASGHCANPECRTNLFKAGKNFAVNAHIVPHAKTQDDSFNNLVLICSNCHSWVDKSGKQEEILREWKNKLRETIQQITETQFESFEAMSEKVSPILERNKVIYENYYQNADSPELWKLFESEILENNENLLRIFEANMRLLSGRNHKIALEFIGHIKEFKETRGKAIPRTVLFPEELNFIFGVDQIGGCLAQSVSALQNFIKLLKRERRFIKLDIIGEPPTLYYKLKGRKIFELRLDHSSRAEQIYWNTYSYRPHTTALRLESLIFFLGWLYDRGLTFSFPDVTDLTRININGKNGVCKVKLVYEYCLSAADLRRLSPEPGLNIVNIYNWNGDGCVSAEAYNLQIVFKIKIFPIDQFYLYAHEHLKLW